MAERAAALCEQYVPDRHVNESQARQLVNTVAGNALIGRGKSVVIAFIDYKASRRWIREMMFHEFAHIYCAKMEMDGEHFIDIYGSGTTPENPDMTPAERQYDGLLVAGHYVWSEFIAQYYALLHTEPRGYRIAHVTAFVNQHIGAVSHTSDELSKDSFAHIMASLLTCVGGPLSKGNMDVEEKMLRFLTQEKHRCFLEIGHHIDPKQVAYNRDLLAIHQATGIPLIAGTDTHALNEEHLAGRKIMQLAKRIHFSDEGTWDLQMRSYDELCEAFRLQGVLPEAVWSEAIENTNRLADMIEPFEIDRGLKYPRLCENPVEVLREKVAAARGAHPYVNQRHSQEVLDSTIDEELSVYDAAKSAEYMLLQAHLVDWERSRGVRRGYGRGSVNGSLIAYILGITEMDSIKFDLNFFRFMSPTRVTNLPCGIPP